MHVKLRLVTSLIVGAAAALGAASAHAGPCTGAIAKFKAAVRQSGAGPTAPQSVGAQLDRQPTPASMKRAQKRAKAQFATVMARAKRLDARGSRSCARALRTAKRLYDLQ